MDSEELNNTNLPFISVIIPTYNREKIIKRAINSILKQTFNNFELIIIDDYSSDNTKELIDTIQDKRIRYYKHDKNYGQNKALNTGLDIANGDYISFLDSDDEWLPTMLERQMECFLEDEGLGVVYSYAGYLHNDKLDIAKRFDIEGYIYKEALTQGYVSHMITMMVKKKCFDKIGNFDINFKNCQDDDICIRLAKYYKYKLVREVLAIIHNDAGNQITKDRKDYALGWWKLFNKFEKDTVIYCDNDIVLRHIDKCMHLFIDSKQYLLYFKALVKSLKYDKYNLFVGIKMFIARVIFGDRIVKNIKALIR